MIEYKMFEGCTIGNRIPFIEAASRRVLEKIGIKTSQAPFACCPDPTGIKCFDDQTWLVMGARNLCLAEAEGKDIISLCNGCANTLRGVKAQLKQDSLKKLKVNAKLAKIGKEYKDSIDVKHFVDVLKVNLNAIRSKVIKQLTGLKVACHPGCHYMRPTEWMESDDPMQPKNLKELAAITGANIIDYDELTLCCGNAITGIFPDTADLVLKRKLDSIIRAGADVLVVNCPACFQQFDTKQRDLGKKFNANYNIPVLYITELLALAMGINPDDIGLKFHRIKLFTILEKLGL
ncbi:MAG: CoB--CoM heterodisulfide reductase iron-sulfur subunit B family protein [Candidatus Odinarchaeota archaeon]